MRAETTALGRILGIGLAAAAVALVALPAAAQSDRDYDDGYDQDGAYTTDEMTVYAPRTLGRSAIGAPIRRVSTSRVVEMGDLDLSTSWGARELRHRIEMAARDACDDLDARYPITDESSPDCYATAVHNGEAEAEDLTGYMVAER